MPVRILVVDDSSFFCRRVAEILNGDPELRVIAVANNGAEAVKKALDLKPDVITMDVEMPVMDGVTAMKQILAQHKCAVIMLSSLTFEGARVTLEAMSAGASDFILKSYEDISGNQSQTAKLLRDKVKEIGLQFQRKIAGAIAPPPAPVPAPTPAPTPTPTPAPAPVAARNEPSRTARKNYRLCAIGSSTGGPVALQQVLGQLPKNYPLPIVIAQHMPGTFTPAFAQRLDGLCHIGVVEATDGMELQSGVAYLAPGGKQMTVEKQGEQLRVRIRDTDARLQYAPCVDVLFGSAANAVNGAVLALILTGMGADGREGSRLLRERGATIWAQDEASCVVYGMPMAVVTAGLAHAVLPLGDIGRKLAAES